MFLSWLKSRKYCSFFRPLFFLKLICQRELRFKKINWKLNSQREKERLHMQIIELEKKLDAKQALELEIQRLRGAVQVMKHIGNDGDEEAEEKLGAIQDELKEKEEELEGLEALNQALIVKERKTNDELQDARKELINVRMHYSSHLFHELSLPGSNTPMCHSLLASSNTAEIQKVQSSHLDKIDYNIILFLLINYFGLLSGHII